MPSAAPPPLKLLRKYIGRCVPSYCYPVSLEAVVQTVTIAIQPVKDSRDA